MSAFDRFPAIPPGAPRHRRARHLLWTSALLLLAACGGGGGGGGGGGATGPGAPAAPQAAGTTATASATTTTTAGALPQSPSDAGGLLQPVVTAATVPSTTPPPAIQAPVRTVARLSLATVPAPFNNGVEDPGLLLLLLPDDQSTADARVTAWIDAASEIGTRIAPITDSQFLAMGEAKARKYAGLVLPDQLHVLATDQLLTAVRAYVTAGGRALLTYDFGALTLNGNGQPVYPIPKSRLSDLAGVDYVLYDSLLDKMVGLGPVTAMRSTMRELLVPPGKSVAYVEPQAQAQVSSGVLGAAALRPGEALYLRASPGDPGGVKGFDPQQFQMLPQYSVRDRQLAAAGQVRPRTLKVDFGKAFKARQPAAPTRARAVGTALPQEPLAAADGGDARLAPLAPQAEVETLDAYHGYLLGNLIYPTYVTTGTFNGAALANSPQFGLAAGVNTVGTGKVLFVNLPLTYLKDRTDALPMHGFLRYFLQHLVQGARLSPMPNAVAGMTLDWHLDSMAAQTPTLALEASGVFSTYTFSMEMTAGPDTIVPGDGLGWNLNNNTVAQQLLQRMDARGHAIGSHGGWIHDYYGDGATEDNQADFLPFLVMNRSAVDGAVGHATRDYSAPQGNNPLWAMDWLEQQGVVAAYFGGHTGLGATRHYRDGALRNPALWVFPVTPEGLYATFEEFQDYGVPKAEVVAWYRAMVDFSVNYNTSRMVYMHPPGANRWSDVVRNLLTYAKNKGAKFAWYTMPRLADFMATRQQVAWTQTVLANGTTRFTASHPASLAEMVWMLPKARYLKPTLVLAGSATVADGGTFWLVKGAAVTQAQFQAKPNLLYVP